MAAPTLEMQYSPRVTVAASTFDEVMAVGFWDLDLAISGERFMFQELYHLAIHEPGQSIVTPSMNGVDTVIPDTWVSGGVPEHGKVALFFVRSAALTICFACWVGQVGLGDHLGSVDSLPASHACSGWVLAIVQASAC